MFSFLNLLKLITRKKSVPLGFFIAKLKTSGLSRILKKLNPFGQTSMEVNEFEGAEKKNLKDSQMFFQDCGRSK